MPLASTYPVFATLLNDLAAHADDADQAARLQGQRSWFVPSFGGWSGEVLDVPSITTAFDRGVINTAIAAALVATPPPREYDTAAMFLQLEYVSAAERAFRTRHGSAVRARLHAAARHAGHASVDGVLLAGVRDSVERMLTQGALDDQA